MSKIYSMLKDDQGYQVGCWEFKCNLKSQGHPQWHWNSKNEVKRADQDDI